MDALLVRRQSFHLLALMLALILTACGGGGGNSGANTGPELSRIELTPSQPTLAKGSALSLTATGIYSDNSTRSLNAEATWVSSDDSLASVSASGEISALNKGLVTIEASLDGVSGSAQINVTDATLVQLDINPSSTQLAKGTRQAISLVGHYTDGTTQEVSEQASWTIVDPAVASLSSPVINGDLWLTGLAVGSTQLTASLGGINTQAAITVTDAILTRIDISPDPLTLPLGSTANLIALGQYSDGTSQDLSEQVNWSSSDSGIVAINASGGLQAQSLGSATITASLASVSRTVTVTVSDAVLSSIEISAAADTLPLGTSQALLALGHYSDGSLLDITEQVVWQSTPAAVVAVSNASGSRGLATALAMGSTTVSATLDSITGNLGLTVSTATLSSIDITPASARLAAGFKTQFHAIGHYSDDSISDISQQASWVSADSGIAVATNTIEYRGHVLGVAPGSTTVTATLDGHSGNATLTVSSASLLAIDVSPSQLSLATGAHQSLTARGSFSDGSVQDLSDQVVWESVKPSKASVSNGTVSGIQADADPIRIIAGLSKVSGTSYVTVTSATLSSLLITPSSPSLAAGTATQLHVTATYTDATQEDVTARALWTSSDPSTLSVENSTGNQGHLSALAEGSATVTAELGGMQASTSATVTNATLTGLDIVAAKTSLDSAEQLQLSAIGTFSDATTQDLTADTLWSSDAPSLAQVSNVAADRGQVLAGIGVGGTAVITASYGGFSPTQTLTINNTPQQPASLVVLAAPNALINDGSDTSTLEVHVQAADPTATVADGTVIVLDISKDGITLSTQNLLTTGGVASTSFTTTQSGLLEIEARVNGTALENATLLYAAPTITNVLIGQAFANFTISGSQILSGAQFGFLIHNLSNRDFPLSKYQLRNGADILITILDASALNNNALTGGTRVGIITTINSDITNQGITARYYLTEPGTDLPFFYSVNFNTL